MVTYEEILNSLPFLSIDEVDSLRLILTEEVSNRISDNSDVNSLISLGFDSFPDNGSLLPNISSGVLIALGQKIERSRFSHDCSFLKVGDGWCWDHPDKIDDEIRTGAGRFNGMRSVTLIPALEGMSFDQIVMKMRNGVHEVKAVNSFTIIDSKIVPTASRKSQAIKHR